LKVHYDEPLSNFAFNFNLRRYNEVEDCYSDMLRPQPIPIPTVTILIGWAVRVEPRLTLI